MLVFFLSPPRAAGTCSTFCLPRGEPRRIQPPSVRLLGPLLPAGAAGGRLLQEALAPPSGPFSEMGSQSAAGCEHGAEEGGRGAIDLFAIGRVGGLDALHESVLTVPVRLAVVRVGSPAAWGGFSAVTAAGREH